MSSLERHNQGMLPRLRGVEIKEADEDLVLLLADQFYPDLTHIDQIEDPQEKRGWITLAVQILRGQEAVIRHAAATFGEVFQPGVEAQVADTLRKSAAEEQEREERRDREIEKHKAELFRIAAQESLDGERWALEKKEREKRLELEEEERKTKLRLEEEERERKLELEEKEREVARKDRHRRETFFIGVASVTLACAVAAFVVGVVSGQAFILGGSGVTGLAALGTILGLVHSDGPPPPPPPSSGGASSG